MYKSVTITMRMMRECTQCRSGCGQVSDRIGIGWFGGCCCCYSSVVSYLMVVDGGVRHGSVGDVGRGMGHVGRRMGDVGGGVGRGVVHHWGMGDVGRGVGRRIGGGVSHDGSVSHIGGGVGDGLNDRGSERGLADDCVESVDGIGSVVDGAAGAIGLGEGVLASHDVSVTGLVLVLVVSGDGVLDIVGEGILGMGIVLNGLYKEEEEEEVEKKGFVD